MALSGSMHDLEPGCDISVNKKGKVFLGIEECRTSNRGLFPLSYKFYFGL